MLKHTSVFILILLSKIVFAENIYEAKHKIDIWKESTLKNARTTEDILSINDQAYKKWDIRLNDVYNSLLKKIPEKDRRLLRESQRQWLAYRSPEFKFMAIHIQRSGGSLSKVITSNRQVEFIRNRVVELEAYEFIFDSPP
ncbi:MAG: lysozyme inhibitor LprI family protein [Gammaproteobacteria bacterium]